MAITTTNGKLSIMELEDWWEPGLPLLPGSLGQNDRQELILGYWENLWGPYVPPPALVHRHAYESPYNYGYSSPINYGYR